VSVNFLFIVTTTALANPAVQQFKFTTGSATMYKCVLVLERLAQPCQGQVSIQNAWRNPVKVCFQTKTYADIPVSYSFQTITCVDSSVKGRFQLKTPSDWPANEPIN